jgi:hypothetical protein
MLSLSKHEGQKCGPSLKEVTEQANHQLQTNENDDVPFQPVAGACGQQVSHGIGRLANDL